MDEIEVELCSGPRSGDVFRISSRPLVFGRTNAADIVFDWDERISSRHIQIQRVAGDFILTDLKSRNGTRVNKQSIKTCKLENGDNIRVGQTLLRIREALQPKLNPYQPHYAKSEDATQGDTGETPAEESEKSVTCTLTAIAVECPSGLMRLHGPVPEEHSASIVVQQIFEAYDGNLMMIVDFKRSGIQLPEIDAAASSPFSTFVAENAIPQLPIVIERDQAADWKSVVDAAWGKNALVVIGTSHAKPEFVEKLSGLLSKSAQGRPHSSGGVLGLCWPAILSAVLSTGSEQVRDAFLAAADLAWLEDDELLDHWQVYGNQETIDKVATGASLDLGSSKQTSG